MNKHILVRFIFICSVFLSPVIIAQPACTTFFYCTSSATLAANEEIFNVSIGTLNNSSTCGTTGGPNSIINLYSDYAGMVAAPTLSAGSTYTLSVTVGQCGSSAFSGIITAYIDYDQNGSLSDPGELIYTSPYSVFSVAGTTFTANVTIPSSATSGTTRMRVIAAESTLPIGECGSYGYGETEDYCVDIAPTGPCAGAPASNTVVATPTAVCSGGSSTLSLAASYSSGGYVYQWSSASSATGPYTAIGGATLSTLTATNITSNTWYQCVITCTNGPASTTAVPAMVNASGTPCQCYTYCASSAGFAQDDEIFNVSLGTLNNTSSCGTTGGAGSILNQYSNYAGIVPSPLLAAGSTYTFSVNVGQCSGAAYSGVVTAYIDYNQNGLFTDPGELIYTSSYSLFMITGTTFTANITIPATAATGTTRLRVIADENGSPPPACGSYNWGETEDYCVTIGPPPTCSGTPSSNTVVASPATVCAGGTTSLSLAASYTVTGFSYQWSSAPSSSGPYTAISGATLSTLTATNITASTWYQCVITCTASAASTTATPVQVSTGGNACQCLSYCSSAASFASDEDIYLVSIGTLTNSSSCTTTGGPGSTLNLYSNYTGIVAAPNLTTSATYTLSVIVGECSGASYNGYVTAFIDYNKNGLFSDPGEQIYTSPYTLFAVPGSMLNTTVTIPATATSGITRMRVIVAENNAPQPDCGSYTWGETEDYCVNIVSAATCTSVAGGTLTPATFTVCSGQQITLGGTGFSTGSGIAYQWKSSTTPGGPYSNVTGGAGATASSYTTGPLSSGIYYYVLQTTCTSASLTANSNEATVTVVASPSVTVSPTNTFICQPGGSAVTLSAGGASSYTWSPATGLSATTGSTVSALPSSTTIYTVTGVTSGCAGVAAATVTTGSLVTVSATATPSAACMGSVITLSASGASSYTWSTGSTAASFTVMSLISSVYTVTGGNSGCTGSSAASVTVFSTPSLTIVSTPTALCSGNNGNTATITASGASTYTWNTGATGANIVVSPSITTNYTVSGSNANGCISSAIITESVVACPGIIEYYTDEDINVYPNPAREFVNVILNTPAGNAEFELYDVLGRVVLKEKLTKKQSALTLLDLPSGLYTYKIKQGAEVLKQGKLVVE